MAVPKPQPNNRLLGLLPKSVQQRFADDSEIRSFKIKDVLYEADQPMSCVYFPINCVMSMIATMDSGMEIEVATTGNEGMIGLPLFLGADRTPLRAFCQVPGDAVIVTAKQFRKHLDTEPELHAVLHRFAQALMMQISQSTTCNRAHNIDQRCSRWLLMTHDRVDRDEFPLTQEFLAQMLGVRRATVGEVAGELQAAKLIRYSRGVIRILNRRALEKRSCGCDFVIRDEYERMLNGRTSR